MKGKGKGDQGGKAGGKGLPYKGMTNNSNNGWGYQGVCWNCGEVGHKSNECQMAVGLVEGGWDN